MSENYKKTKAKGIVDDLTKEQIREILVDEAEIFYKGTYCVIMNDDENVFTIGTANKECETDEVEELETKYDDIDEADEKLAESELQEEQDLSTEEDE